MDSANVYNASILNWIADNEVKNEKGDVLNFHDRPFLLDILNDWSKEIVVQKCSQVGGSVCFSLKCCFLAYYYPYSIIYTFPTDSDTSEFVSTKINPILRNNAGIFGSIDTDNIERKEINKSFIYFKGTVSKTGPISTTADVLIHDEADRSDQPALVTYRSRIKSSTYKARWLFSNPTTDKGATDESWKQSDQKEWVIPCPHCGVEDFMVFPESIDFTKEEFICRACKKPLSDDDRRAGHWQAQNPGAEVSGYHLSHLMAPWISAHEIIADSKLDQEYFYNFVLGLPYNPGDISVTKTTITDLWTPKPLLGKFVYMGVDVGNIKHYCIGSELGIYKVGTLTKASELDALIAMYKPNVGIIDALPDTVLSRYIVETYPNWLMWFPGENDANPQTIVWYGQKDKEGIIYTNRNRILDQMITDMIEGGFALGMPIDENFRKYVNHFLTLRRIKETNSKGIERFIWDSTTGEDHFCFGTLYWYLARMTGGQSGLFLSDSNEKKIFINHDNKVGIGDLKSFIENREW